MKFRAVALLTLLACLNTWAVVGPFSSTTFAWERALSHGTNISYVLKFGTTTNNYTDRLNVGTNLQATVTNLTSGFLYFVVVASTPEGLESEPSNLVSVTNYPASPIRLRMKTNTLETVRLEGTRNNGVEWQHLATITNDPAIIFGSMRSMLIRASTIKPPLP